MPSLRALWVACWLAALPAAAFAEPSLQVLQSPVRAGETTKLRATLPGAQGPIRGVAAMGSVGAFTEVEPGVWEAEYAPPPKTGPAQSLVVAFEDRPGGLLATALANISDTASFKTRLKKREVVFVRAGAVRKGPFHADGKGELSFTLPVSGELEAVQLESAQGRALGTVPVKAERARVAVLARPGRVRPGEAAPAEVLVVGARGEKLVAAALKVSAGEGKLAVDPEGTRPGLLRYAFTPPAQAAGDIPVRVADDKGKPLAQTAFALAGPRVARIEVKLPPKPLATGELAQFTVSLRDEAGRPADGDLTLEVDAGNLVPPLQMAPGLYTASFTAPGRVPHGATVKLKATARSGPRDEPVTASVDIAMARGKPAKVVFAPAKPLKPGEAAQVRLEVLDAQGNPVEAEKLRVDADHGEITGLQPAGDGAWLATYRAPEGEARPVTLSAHDGPFRLEGEQRLELQAPEASGEPRLLVGPTAGFTNNLGQVSTASLGGLALVRIWALASAGLFAGYLPARSVTLQVTPEGDQGQIAFSRLPIHLRGGALYTAGPLEVHGGLEGGPTRLSGTATALGETISISGWHPEFGVYAGGGYRLGPGYLSVEVRGSRALIDLADKDIAVHGSVGGIDGAVGYLFAI